MGRAGLAIALIAAVITSLLFVSAAQSFADQLRGDISGRSENVEAADREAGGAGERTVGSFFNHKVPTHSSAGSEASN